MRDLLFKGRLDDGAVIGPHGRDLVGQGSVIRGDDGRQAALAPAQQDVERRDRFGAREALILL